MDDIQISSTLYTKVEQIARKFVPTDREMQNDLQQVMFVAIVKALHKNPDYNATYLSSRAKSRAINFLKRERRYVLGADHDFAWDFTDTHLLTDYQDNHRNEVGEALGEAEMWDGFPMIANHRRH